MNVINASRDKIGQTFFESKKPWYRFLGPGLVFSYDDLYCYLSFKDGNYCNLAVTPNSTCRK